MLVIIRLFTYKFQFYFSCFQVYNPNSGTVSDFAIELAFETKVFVERVEIYETYNPGAVVRIWCCDLLPDEIHQNAPQYSTRLLLYNTLVFSIAVLHMCSEVAYERVLVL